MKNMALKVVKSISNRDIDKNIKFTERVLSTDQRIKFQDNVMKFFKEK